MTCPVIVDGSEIADGSYHAGLCVKDLLVNVSNNTLTSDISQLF